MSKSFLIGARIWNDTSEPKVVKGLVIQMVGYQEDKYVVYEVTSVYDGFIYRLINLRTHKFSQTEVILPLSKKHGIGYYFDEENPTFLDDFEIFVLHAEAEKLDREERQTQEEEQQRKEALQAIGRERLLKLIPADAKAIIIAELHRNESDSQTDYFSYGIDRTVILGFSNHTKDLFSEMRKYAANFEDTAHLAEENKDYENREKYSMGAGYYLGKNKYSGWIVKKVRFYGSIEKSIEYYALAAGDDRNICIKVQTTDQAEVPEAITGDFIIVDYSEKAIAVFGDTRPIKDYLSALGGRFNPKLTYQDEKRAGWIFSKTKEQEVRNLLNIK